MSVSACGAPVLSQVVIDPVSACGRCAGRAASVGTASAGCGIRLMATPPLQILCENAAGARPGDRVRVDAGPEPAGWLSVVALAYGLPVVMLVLGAVLGDALAGASAAPVPLGRDAASAIGALAGLIGGLITGRYASRVLVSARKTRDTARIVAILPTATALD